MAADHSPFARRAGRWRAPAPKRAPIDHRRYQAQVRHASRRLPRYEHPLPVSLAVSVVFAVAGLALLQLVGVGLGAGIQQLAGSVVGSIPQPGKGDIVLGETQVTVSAAPVLEGLPEFTRSSAVPIGGKVPAFAVRPGRIVAVAVNGRTVATYPILDQGRFGGAPLTLADGASTVTAALLDGTTEIASASATVVVDRTPPALSITRPKARDTVEGPEVIVEGKTEPGADVTVNDRPLRPNLDGTFTDRVVAAPGITALTIVAKDKAGNETAQRIEVTVKPAAQITTAGTSLSVTLDRAKVRPGETVVARVIALESGKAKAGLAVTLQVGVVTIGTRKTDATGAAVIGFAAPNHEVDDAAVVVSGGGTSARALLTVSAK